MLVVKEADDVDPPRFADYNSVLVHPQRRYGGLTGQERVVVYLRHCAVPRDGGLALCIEMDYHACGCESC